ncbi:receptor-like protein EIX1 [Zingiber officinale]|uniref:receptor-like protein EIX1 n=1 Tax=Zingiber officinale TaxID=94328 RepID=UPI001C4B59AD|nr:receptor-like protein EIX1 [Zingiber officinale]
MATAWRRSTLCFRERWPLHHPQYYRCYYQLPADLVMLCWLIMMAFFLVEVAGVLEGRVSSEGCLPREKDALLLYKAAIEDPSDRLSSWQEAQGDDCCAWTGVVCYNRTGRVRVAELNLQNPIGGQLNWWEYSLRGELLHPSLLSLSHLQSLNLSFNDFEATQIPPLVGSLHKLRYLDLSESNFSGNIPLHLGNLTDLRYLDLNSYYFPIVSQSLDWLSGLSSLIYLDMSYLDLSAASHNWISAVNMLPSLQHLYLFDCKINNIPLSLSFHLNLSTSLVDLNLGFNNFNSSFPNWFWNLTSLSSLQLSECEIGGMLPIEIGNLISLTHFDLSLNLLSGPLPDTLWKLKHLKFLDLNHNLLGNSLPMGIMNLSSLSTLHLNNWSLPPTLFTPKLQHLILSHNHINGSIPPNICKFHTFRHLNLSNNQIFGEIPRCWQKGSFIRYINLGNNMVFGEIPSSLGNLMKLEFLHLNNNNLKGHLPSSLQNCSRLLIVDFGDNKFSGNIPSWIGQSWQRLRILRLSSNMFNGNIDSQLGYLRDLQIIDFANNKLSGTIPHSFGNFSTMISSSVELLPSFDVPMEILEVVETCSGSESITLVTKGDQLTFSSILYLVKSIDLSNNELTYEIPEELGYLVGLHTLNLSRNYFKGKIPDSISKMSSLETLDLSFNNLSGVIPQGLSQLNALSHLNLSYNNLSGNIPSGNQLQTLDDVSIYIAGVEGRVSSEGCLQRERDALLLYKAAIKDPSGRLSSWRAQVDCCAWTDVVCHNTTGIVRVAELNLQNPNANQDDNLWETASRGELLHPSLLSLTHL